MKNIPYLKGGNILSAGLPADREGWLLKFCLIENDIFRTNFTFTHVRDSCGVKNSNFLRDILSDVSWPFFCTFLITKKLWAADICKNNNIINFGLFLFEFVDGLGRKLVLSFCTVDLIFEPPLLYSFDF